jgi:hypothetical protein
MYESGCTVVVLLLQQRHGEQSTGFDPHHAIHAYDAPWQFLH